MRISKEIAFLSEKVDSLSSKIEEEKKARTIEANASPIAAKKDELEQQLAVATERLLAIEGKLTKAEIEHYFNLGF